MFLLLVLFVYAAGVDMMKQQCTEHKQEDFLDWDDNESHTENF